MDAVIKDEIPEDATVPRHVTDYVKNVERAASDLTPRSERDRVLRELLQRAFDSKTKARG